MSIQSVNKLPFDSSTLIEQDSLLLKLPNEVISQCLIKFKLRDLLNFSQTSKKSYIATMKPEIWTAIARVYNFTIVYSYATPPPFIPPPIESKDQVKVAYCQREAFHERIGIYLV